MKIIIYSKKVCPFCVKAKSFFDNLGLEYQEIDISDNDELREKMIKITDRKTVPQIFIDDFHVGGYTDLIEIYENGKLKEILNSKNFPINEDF